MAMSTKGSRRSKRDSHASAVAEVEQEVKMIPCPTCHGTGIEEFNHGLVARKCLTCEGKGKVKVQVKDGG